MDSGSVLFPDPSWNLCPGFQLYPFRSPTGIWGARGPPGQPGDPTALADPQHERRPGIPWASRRRSWSDVQPPPHTPHCCPEPWPAPSDHPQPRLCSCISKNPFPDKQSPQPRLPPNRHLRPPGLGIKACFAKEALCLEKHPSPAAHSFKEPALFCAQKAPPDLRAGSGLTWADVGGLLISGQAPTPLGEGRDAWAKPGEVCPQGTVPFSCPLTT